jgi:hypothetical protein
MFYLVAHAITPLSKLKNLNHQQTAKLIIITVGGIGMMEGAASPNLLI